MATDLRAIGHGGPPETEREEVAARPVTRDQEQSQENEAGTAPFSVGENGTAPFGDSVGRCLAAAQLLVSPRS